MLCRRVASCINLHCFRASRDCVTLQMEVDLVLRAGRVMEAGMTGADGKHFLAKSSVAVPLACLVIAFKLREVRLNAQFARRSVCLLPLSVDDCPSMLGR